MNQTRLPSAIVENLFNDPPPPPPPNAGEVQPNTAGEKFTVRERLERHRKEPPCASCHATLDPYGMALENYDAIGRGKHAATIVDDYSFARIKETAGKPDLYSSEMGDSNPDGFTASNEHGIRGSKRSAVFPVINPEIPVRPTVPITIKSISCCSSSA